MTIQDTIQQIISENPVTLFMKGTADFPQCGFSSLVVQVLKRMEVPFFHVNVLDSDEMRQGIKDFASWPTIPQLYVKGEFVGGCDIIKDMYTNGELETLMQNMHVQKIS